ncbi:uncharacterized protein LOC120076783 isoform X1 [Benincasa hispida]|uniref:uncharacterized protein LOC120076783 isoform X1 n=1 Tax=Benincasa hispida TaxID=102211 RepID=UPI0019022273|nr:uncharacterized protein LOC120076783 isoform X1 [Benincasa hispida]
MVLKDEWLCAAMADDSVVVELLVRLKQSQASSSIKSPLPTVIPPRWGLRQRRSRILSPFRFDAIAHKNKDSTSTRCSPTTPLSWSGDTSPSATADGFEESSHPSEFSHSSRSKGCGTNEFSSSTAMAKRLKRRKALADLRVEESLLLKERVHLRKELESLHATFKEQTTNNEKLKKMKLNLNFNASSDHLRDESKPVAPNQQCQSVDPTTDNVPATSPIHTVPGNGTQSELHETREINSMESGGFFLPDLNMIPAEDCL